MKERARFGASKDREGVCRTIHRLAATFDGVGMRKDALRNDGRRGNARVDVDDARISGVMVWIG